MASSSGARPSGALPPRHVRSSSGNHPGFVAAAAGTTTASRRNYSPSADGDDPRTDDAVAAPDGGGDQFAGGGDEPLVDRRASLRRQYDQRRRDRDAELREDRRRRRSEGGRRGSDFRRREAERMRTFGRDQDRGLGGDAGGGGGDAGGEATPLLPPRHDARRIDGYEGRRGWGGGGGYNKNNEYADDSDGGGSGWDSDAAGTGASAGGGVSVVSRASYTSSRALALPGIFQNLSRCVVPSEHEVVSDVDGVAGSGSSCSSSEEGGDSASGEEEDWEGVDEFDDEDGSRGGSGDEDEGRREYELSPPQEERRKGHSVVPDDGHRQAQRTPPPPIGAKKSGGGNIPAHIRTPPKRHISDPLPRILPRHHRSRSHHSQELDDGRRHHSSGGAHHHSHHRHRRLKRSVRRRMFLLLTEPQTSIASAAFFVVLIVAITLSNILMMLQTMDFFQFTPPECNLCGGTNEYYSTNDDTNYFGPTYEDAPIPCECPPVPYPLTVWLEDAVIWFFTVEWVLRVVCYEPARKPSEPRPRGRAALVEWSSYLTETTTVLDFLAIFPYYLERYEQTNGLLSLRLLRLFRVFQLVRLGQYNVTFLCLINVLAQAIMSLNLLIIVLVFGAAFFGSMIYWLEKGEWKYTEVTDPPSFAYVRFGVDGESEEVSPFTSIPASFWWFIVTATTVGYGDIYPTSTGGKCVAALAMLMGVLVIAFPVSVFSDLWSRELKKAGVLREREEGGSQGNGGGGGRMHEETPEKHSQKGTPGTQLKVPKEVGGALNGTSKSGGREQPLSRGDVDAIVAHLRVIDESQAKIRNILKNSLVSS